MSRRIFGLFVVWVASALVPTATAQAKLERRTTIDVTEAAPRDVYGSLSRVLGYELAVAPDVQQPVTMHLENVTVRTALTALSENLGCRWNIDGNTLRVEPVKTEKPGPVGVAGSVSGGVVGGVPGGIVGGVRGGVTGGVPGGIVGGVPAGAADFKHRLERKTPAKFNFLDTPLRAIIEALGKVAGLGIEVEDPFEMQHVTVDLSDRTVLSALRALQSESGTVFVVTFSGSDRKMHVKVNLPRPDD